MLEVLVVLLVFVLVALVATIVRAPARAEQDELRTDRPPTIGTPLVREHPYVPWIAALVVTLALIYSGWLFPWVAVAVGAVAGVSVVILLRTLAARRIELLEFQLADGIDLIVSTLRAGSGLVDAIAGAAHEARRPLRPYIEELLDRIRLGERPEHVIANLEQRVPVESFRLFLLTLAAQWEGGGSMATTLSNVGRTIRDRVDVRRRIRSQAIETQVSVVGVLVITYGLALLTWHNYPDRFESFATSQLGSMFIGASILMQAIGLFWISRLTRIEV